MQSSINQWPPTPSSTYVLFINTSYRSATARCVLTADFLWQRAVLISFFPRNTLRWTVLPECTGSVWHVCRLCVTTSRHAHAWPGCCCGAVKGQQLLQKPSLNASAECSKAHFRPFSLSDRNQWEHSHRSLFSNSPTLLTKFCFWTSL